MLYFANPTRQAGAAMASGLIGMIDTPMQGNTHPPAAVWCADNGRYGKGWPGYWRWATWLSQLPRAGCVFAVAPDVVGDAAATLRRAGPGLRLIHRLGFPAAYAAQNGSEAAPPPWPDLDVLFLGGDDSFKLGPLARDLTREARERGKWVHMGRVNSLRRLRYASHIGCDSADGTYLTFGPDENLPKLLGWLRAVNGQGVLWKAGA